MENLGVKMTMGFPAKIFATLLKLSPSPFQNKLWKWWYQKLSKSHNKKDFRFMNYGYIDSDPPDLEPDDEPYRLFIQLYEMNIRDAQLNDKEVYFGIRPEHVYYKKSNEEDFEVNLKADLSEYIGHEQIMTFNLANQELLAKFPSTIKIELNNETKLYFDLTQVSLFDANTQERL